MGVMGKENGEGAVVKDKRRDKEELKKRAMAVVVKDILLALLFCRVLDFFLSLYIS